MSAQEFSPSDHPSLLFRGETYILGNVGANAHEFFNEYFPEGVEPAQARKSLAVRHYPKTEDPAAFAAGFVQSLESQTPGLKTARITTPDANTEGLSYLLENPGGGLAFNLFFFVKVPDIDGLYAKHLIVKSNESVDAFRAEARENQHAWLKDLVALSFPPVIHPKNVRANGSVDLSKLPPLERREETVGDLEFAGVTVSGLSVGSEIVVDETFTSKWKNSPPSAAFRVMVPKIEELLMLAGGKKSGVPELLRITLPDEKKEKALEIIRFAQLRVPLHENPEDRLKHCAYLLRSQVVPMVFKGKRDAKIIETYSTEIGENQAVVFHGSNLDPESGDTYFVKVAGILHPKKPAGVLVFLSAHAEESVINSTEDLATAGMGLRVMHSLKFVDD